jgi:hypothetical protein
MDASKVATFCTLASELLAQVTAYVAQDAGSHGAEDNAQVRQLRVATSALNTALETLARMTPPPMPPAFVAPASSPKP